MSSFYGGREGRSFVITRNFSSVKEMVEKFQQGPSYNEVHFDEYVLINTVNKANPENGQVFRRGYDYNSERQIDTYNAKTENNETEITFAIEKIPAGGAIYVGTIAGPAGRAPVLRLAKMDDVKALGDIATLDVSEWTGNQQRPQTIEDMLTYLRSMFEYGNVPVDKDGNVILDGTDPVYLRNYVKIINLNSLNEKANYYFYYDKILYEEDSEASIGWYMIDTPLIIPENKYSIEDGHLVPGVEYSENLDINSETGYIHKIPNKYQDTIDWAYCSIRNENNEDTTAYIGFKLPYTVFEYEAKSVDAYYNRNDERIDGRITNKFENVNLVEKIDTSTKKKDEDGNEILDENGNPIMEEHPFYSKWLFNIPKGIKGESIKNIRVITADDSVEAFDVDDNGNLQYNEDGSIKIKKDYGEENQKENDIANQRKIIVYDYYYYDRYLEGEHYVIYLGDFNIVDKVELAHNGKITMGFSHDNDYVTKPEDWVHWIDDMHFDENGTVTVTFNDLEWTKNQIINGVLKKPSLFHWITYMEFKDDGSIKVEFNNTDISQGSIQNGIIDLPQFMTWLTDFTISESGDIDIIFNNKNEDKDIHLQNYIRKIDDIVLQDTGIETDNSVANNQKIRITYNTKTDGINKDTVEIGNPINYVMKVERDDSTNHLLLLHSDPARRANYSTTYNGIQGWQDLGGLGYIMTAPEPPEGEEDDDILKAKKDALSVGGVWLVTKEV